MATLRWSLLVVCALATGCVAYEAKPIDTDASAAKFLAGSLQAPVVREFFAAHERPWPQRQWSFADLWLVALCCEHQLAADRAEVEVAAAAVLQAGERPNPRFGFAPEYVTNADPGVTPWVLGVSLAVPLELGGKRSARIAVAGVDCVAIRVSFTGDLGWELHCAAADQLALYTALIEAGRDIGAGPVGSRALMSLRVEKGYGSWGRDYSPEYWPQESGLDRLVKADKAFLNKDAWERIAANPAREVMTMLEIDATTADAS
ncbi:MAG: aminomethyltransferase family protein, partial [Planctomycetes bacterium]|nr:aminomethyltransferase family protein [Planctomycetota bacterium]